MLIFALALSITACKKDNQTVSDIPPGYARLEKIELTGKKLTAGLNVKVTFSNNVADNKMITETAPFAIANGQTQTAALIGKFENSMISEPNSFSYHVINTANNQEIDYGYFDTRDGLTPYQSFCGQCLFDAKAYFIK